MVKTQHWMRLDEAVTTLAKQRVGATTVSDMLRVLFYPHPAIFDGLELSGIEVALPLVGSDTRLSLRVENPPTPGA